MNRSVWNYGAPARTCQVVAAQRRFGRCVRRTGAVRQQKRDMPLADGDASQATLSTNQQRALPAITGRRTSASWIVARGLQTQGPDTQNIVGPSSREGHSCSIPVHFSFRKCNNAVWRMWEPGCRAACWVSPHLDHYFGSSGAGRPKGMYQATLVQREQSQPVPGGQAQRCARIWPCLARKARMAQQWTGPRFLVELVGQPVPSLLALRFPRWYCGQMQQRPESIQCPASAQLFWQLLNPTRRTGGAQQRYSPVVVLWRQGPGKSPMEAQRIPC